MVFIETHIFTRLISTLLHEEDYHLVQLHLSIRPESGNIIKGAGGIRKLRWKKSGQGKRGGVRILYYYLSNEDQIFMLYGYSKSDKDDLTKPQLMQLRKAVEEHLL